MFQLSYSFAKEIAPDVVPDEASNGSRPRSTIVSPICVSTHVFVLLVSTVWLVFLVPHVPLVLLVSLVPLVSLVLLVSLVPLVSYVLRQTQHNPLHIFEMSVSGSFMLYF